LTEPPADGSAAAQEPSSNRRRRGQRRDSVATKARILEASREEFALHGYGGGRTDRIAKRADINIRMLYHYFGGKEKLYLAALEATYAGVREREKQLQLKHFEPRQALRKLVEFTFDYMIEDRLFVRLIINENLLHGRFLRASEAVPAQAMPLVEVLETILRRGQEQSVFKRKVSPIQLYVSILALSVTHIAQRHTLSIMFRKDLSDPQWLAERRRHVVDVVLAYLTTDSPDPALGV